jgi:hypothetical protein
LEDELYAAAEKGRGRENVHLAQTPGDPQEGAFAKRKFSAPSFFQVPIGVRLVGQL